MPRPTKLTPERQARIVELLRKGNYRSTAARAAGIDPATMRTWMSKTREPYRSFRAAVEEAEAVAEAELVSMVHAAGPDNFRAAMEMLARKFPTRWSEKTYQGRLGSHGEPVDSKERPQPVLVVPSVIDDIHAWAERAQQRVESNYRTIEHQSDELERRWQALKHEREAELRAEVRAELQREAEARKNRELARLGKLKHPRSATDA